MNNEKIPAGYTQLKKGVLIKKGDIFFSKTGGAWLETQNDGCYVGDPTSPFTYARKTPAFKRKKKSND